MSVNSDGPFSRTDIGSRLREARNSIGLSGRALANEAGLSHGVVPGVEAGRNKPPAELLHALAMHDVDVTWVLTGRYFRSWLTQTARWHDVLQAEDQKGRATAALFGVPYGQYWKAAKLTALKQAGSMVIRLLDMKPEFKLDDRSLDDDSHMLFVVGATMELIKRRNTFAVTAVERLLDVVLRLEAPRPDDVPEEFEEQYEAEKKAYLAERREKRNAENAQGEKR